MATDDVDDVDAREQVLDEALRDHGFESLRTRTTGAALGRRPAAYEPVVRPKVRAASTAVGGDRNRT
jgi:hypothetical protein